MSTSTETSPTLEATKTSGAKRVWFPYVWVGLIVGGSLLFQFGSADRDVKNTILTLAPGLALLGLSIWFVRSSGFSRQIRWTVGLTPWLALLAFFSLVELVNNGDVGIVGWRWRWSAELDEQLAIPDMANTIGDWETTPRDYPRFLGNGHWAEVEGTELETDWEANPPKELWRRRIGAGWSAFSIVGHYAVTQEQRGESELVTCYDIFNGEIVWTHADPTRFDPLGTGGLGGIGPRATPTIHAQRVITHGATGIVNCLDALTGGLLWTHDTLAENNASNVMWGKACSPLVVAADDGSKMVVISVGGGEGRSLIAYDLETGEQLWSGGDHRSSYASPVLAELAGERQILSVNENFVTSHRVSDGVVLWEHPWLGNSDTDATCTQPVPLSADRVFLSKGYGVGCSLLKITAGEEGSMQAQPVWREIKRVMKTKMGNVVIRDGFVYGLDGGLMQCIELESGKKQWKKRRTPAIGHGQIMLIGSEILILTESGELLLVAATPEEYREIADIRVFPADQVTWNNPSFSAPHLLVRNAEEAACYELPLKQE